MESRVHRKYIRTEFEGVFYRYSAKRDPRTGDLDRIYIFWYADAAGKGHWKTVGRHSRGVSAATAMLERAKLLAGGNFADSPANEQAIVTVGQVVEAYRIWSKNEGKQIEQHYRQYSTHLRPHVHSLSIDALSPDLLSSLKARLLKTPAGNTRSKKLPLSAGVAPRKPLAGQTVNNIFSFIRSAINRAIATGVWSGPNPLSTKGGIWKMAPVNNKGLRFLTKDEARNLLEDLQTRHSQLHDMALLSLKTGLRPTEIFKLKGQDIDPVANVLHILSKGGRRVPVRVPADMIVMLLAYGRKPLEPIFQQPRKKTAFVKTPACFRTAVRKLNLAPKDGDSLYAVTLHTMRHTFASWLAQSGKVSLMELQKLMRHESISMTMRYAHLFPGQESEKLSIIDDILK